MTTEPYGQLHDFGEFTCSNCGLTFQKANPTHGANGICAQCGYSPEDAARNRSMKPLLLSQLSD